MPDLVSALGLETMSQVFRSMRPEAVCTFCNDLGIVGYNTDPIEFAPCPDCERNPTNVLQSMDQDELAITATVMSSMLRRPALYHDRPTAKGPKPIRFGRKPETKEV